MKNKIILAALIALPSFAGTLEPVQSSYSYQESPEYKGILATLKSYGEFDAPKALSRGEQLVEEAKARNRARLKEMYLKEKSLSEDKRSELEKWKDEEKETLNSWKRESREELSRWKREQDIFLGRLKVYKENTFVIPAKAEKIVEKKISQDALPDVHIINKTFSVPMKDQGDRPTCVAFAGIRAIEIILAQNNRNDDLSEQYLYWAGKPDCQKAPCKEKGSWIREAYGHSQKQPGADIPLEPLCSYQRMSVPSNETQLPLAEGCKTGTVQVSAFREVRTISEIIESIKKDTPVVVAAKLSENFYRNKGLITLSESVKKNEMDSHSLGHAFLVVGVMELPAKIKVTEGDFCLVVANSWGKGWGAGGYSCVTQKWFEKYRRPSAFIAPQKLTVK